MSVDPYDAQGEVRDALSTAVDSYGKRVLNDPRVLGNLVTDLLPDLPRERSLLVAAAEAGIASELTQNVEGQHMDADTAVALAARSLAENRSLDPAASTWVATEYARALGYQVQSQAPPSLAPPAPWGAPPAPWEASPSPWGASSSPWENNPAGPPAPTVVPEPAYDLTQTTNQPLNQWPPENQWPPAPVPPNPAPGAGPSPGQGASLFQSSSPSPFPGPGPGPAPSPNPSPSPFPGPGLSPSPFQSPSPSPVPGPSPFPSPGLNSSPNPVLVPGPNPGIWSPAPPVSPVSPNQWTPAPPPGGGWPAAPQAEAKPRRGLFVGGGAIVAIVVLYFLAAAVVHTFPFDKTNSVREPTAAATSPAPTKPAASPVATTSPAATSAPTGTLASGLKQLKVLLPYDLTDASTECVEQTKIPWTNPGLVKALDCVAPDMPNGQIFGYQLDSTADYNRAWSNYNTWAQFGASTTENCPPAAGDAQGGPEEWWGPRFAKRSGQVIECFTSNTGPVYVWTYPTEDAFIVAQPPKSWSFSKLETWWEDNSV
jgi:hypothetical protein